MNADRQPDRQREQAREREREREPEVCVCVCVCVGVTLFSPKAGLLFCNGFSCHGIVFGEATGDMGIVPQGLQDGPSAQLARTHTA